MKYFLNIFSKTNWSKLVKPVWKSLKVIFHDEKKKSLNISFSKPNSYCLSSFISDMCFFFSHIRVKVLLYVNKVYQFITTQQQLACGLSTTKMNATVVRVTIPFIPIFYVFLLSFLFHCMFWLLTVSSLLTLRIDHSLNLETIIAGYILQNIFSNFEVSALNLAILK